MSKIFGIVVALAVGLGLEETVPRLELSSVPALFRETRFCAVELRVDRQEATMDGIIYLVGLIVIIMFILSLLGLH
jgi:hypothetical protein